MSKPLDKSGLYPPFAEQLLKFEEKLKQNGINAYLFDGFRDYSEQWSLYNKGRKNVNGKWIVIDKKKIVTNAVPGLSAHNYGVGADYVFDGNSQKQGIQWSWEDKLPWKDLGRIAKECGLEWAGQWITFPEFPHVQNFYGFKIHQLYDILSNSKNPKLGLSKIWDMFNKVNKK